MPRVYVRVESTMKRGEKATPGQEAVCLAVVSKIASVLGVDGEAARTRAKRGSLVGVTLRLDVEG